MPHLLSVSGAMMCFQSLLLSQVPQSVMFWGGSGRQGEAIEQSVKVMEMEMGPKGIAPCLKAVSSAEMGRSGFMSLYSNGLFPSDSRILYTKDISTHQGGIPANAAFPKGNRAWCLTAWALELGQLQL